MNHYPKVLLVMLNKVESDDPSNLLIRTQFGDWPKERLAQIHSGEAAGHGEFCGRYYRLNASDRRLGVLFYKLRGPLAETMSMETVSELVTSGSSDLRHKLKMSLQKRISELLLHSGLWELLFAVRISNAMAEFIEEFAPDVIYCQGYSLGFASLPLLIAQRFNIPICFQTTDDWPTYTYSRFPVGWLLRRRAAKLIAQSKTRMAFGEKMRQVYEQRYKTSFLATYHADQFERFSTIRPSTRSSSCFSIVFTGNLGQRRHEAINDLLLAVRSLGEAGSLIKIYVYCWGIPKGLPESLRAAPEIAFMPLPSHDELPSVLAQADILFLPESFVVNPGTIALSLSTKCHLYMMSQTPILAYGPPYSGTIDYARSGGWAEVVTERNIEQLRMAIVRLKQNHEVRLELTRRARLVAQRNHDLSACREKFRQAIISGIAVSTEGEP
jgi:glycosyltransferase involved in cell wall biosynthesis